MKGEPHITSPKTTTFKILYRYILYNSSFLSLSFASTFSKSAHLRYQFIINTLRSTSPNLIHIEPLLLW